jgi:hypothetical protein
MGAAATRARRAEKAMTDFMVAVVKCGGWLLLSVKDCCF